MKNHSTDNVRCTARLSEAFVSDRNMTTAVVSELSFFKQAH